ncbi:hypothetical protein WDW89_16460 [Deltaproteobacteria bacterium TL4]
MESTLKKLVILLKTIFPYQSMTAVVLTCFAFSLSAQTLTPDLKAVSGGKGWKGSIAATKLVEKDGAAAIEFIPMKQGIAQVGVPNVVWLDGFEFNEGIIEFDAKGKSAPPQSSFVGVAFHTVDAKNFDAIYFRTFNFKTGDSERNSHALQYISEPQWPWEKLRKEKTGQFENSIKSAPDGDAWFHAKVVIEKRQVKVFVNGATEPSLLVNELSDRTGGSVGLWCNGYGVIANLKIMPKK